MSTRSITFVVRARNEARDTLRQIGIDFREQARLAAEAALLVTREVTRMTAGMEMLENRSAATQARLAAVNNEIRETATAAMAADRAITGLTLALANVGTQLRAGLPSLKQFETARERLGQIAAAAPQFPVPPAPPRPTTMAVFPPAEPQRPSPVPSRTGAAPLAAQLQLPSTAFLDEMTKKANNAVVVYRKALDTLETLGTGLGRAATAFNNTAQATINMRSAISGTADEIRPISAALREVQAAGEAASRAINTLVSTSGRLAVRSAAPNAANAAAQAVTAASITPNPRTQPNAAQAPPTQTSSVNNRTAETMERVTRAVTDATQAFYQLTSTVAGYNTRGTTAASVSSNLAGGLNQVKTAAEAAKTSVAALVSQISAVDLDTLRTVSRPAQAAPTVNPAPQSPVPNAPVSSQTAAQVVREASTAVRNIQALGDALERAIARLAVFRVSMSSSAQSLGTFGLASVGAVAGAGDFVNALSAIKTGADAANAAVTALNAQTRTLGGRPLQAAFRTMQTGNANAAPRTTTTTQAGTSAQSLQNVATAAGQAISALQTLSNALPGIGTALNGIAPGFNALTAEMRQFRSESQDAARAVNSLQSSLSKLNPGAVSNMMAAIRTAAAQAATVSAAASNAAAILPPPVSAGGSGGARSPASAASSALAPVSPSGSAAAVSTAAVGQAAATSTPQIANVAQAARRAALGFNEMKQGGNSAYGALNDLGFQAFILQSTLMSLSSITGFAFAVREIAALDQALAELRATTQASAEQMDRFRSLVTQASRGSNFSETEATKGLIELAKAGFDAERAMIALRPAMNLANAGGLEMARATEILVNVMQTYEATAGQTAQISDVLVAAANASTTSVANLATALSYAGPTAAQLRVSLEETSAAIALLAQSGIDGQKAGSQLRAAMSVLISPTQEAQKIFQRLGISLREIDPSRVGLVGAFQRLARANLSASDAARIFGRETQNAVMIMTREAGRGGGEWQRLTDTITNSVGEAQRVASQRLDNLQDDFKRFRDSLARGATAVGDAGLTSSLRDLVQTATMVSEALQGIEPPATRLGQTAANIADTIRTIASAINGWVQNFGALTATLALASKALATFAVAATPVGRVVAMIIALGALAFSVGAQFGLLGQRVTEFVNAVSGWEAALAGLFVFFRASPVGVFVRGLILAITYATTFREESAAAFNGLADSVGEAIDGAVASLYAMFPGMDAFVARLGSGFQQAIQWLTNFGESAGRNMTAFTAGMADGARRAIPTIIASIGNASTWLGGFTRDFGAELGKSVDSIIAFGNRVRIAFRPVTDSIRESVRSAVEWVSRFGVDSSNAFTTDVMPVLSQMGQNMADTLGRTFNVLKSAIADWIGPFDDLGVNIMATLRALRDSVGEMLSQIVSTVTSGARALGGALTRARLSVGLGGERDQRIYDAQRAQEDVAERQAAFEAAQRATAEFRQRANPAVPGDRSALRTLEEVERRQRLLFERARDDAARLSADITENEKRELEARLTAHREFFDQLRQMGRSVGALGNFSERRAEYQREGQIAQAQDTADEELGAAMRALIQPTETLGTTITRRTSEVGEGLEDLGDAAVQLAALFEMIGHLAQTINRDFAFYQGEGASVFGGEPGQNPNNPPQPGQAFAAWVRRATGGTLRNAPVARPDAQDWTAGAEAARAMPPGQIRSNAPRNNGPTDTGRGGDQFDDSVLRLVRRYAPALRTAVESEQNTAVLGQLGGMNPEELMRRYRLRPEDVRMIQERVRELEADPFRTVTEFTEAQRRATTIARMPGTRRDREVETQVQDVQRRLRDQGIDVESFRRQRAEAEGAGDTERVAALTERIAQAETKLAEARQAARESYDAAVVQRFNEQLEETIRSYNQEVELLSVGGVARERRQVQLQAENQLRREGVTDAEALTRAAEQAAQAFDRFQEARQAVQGDPFAGFMRGLQNYAKEVADLATAAERGMQRMVGAIEDALVDMVVTGKANFADLTKFIAAELARIAIRALIIRPLLGAIGFGTAHTGGVIGSPSPNPGRMMLPTRHNGGMIGGEDGANPRKGVLADAITNVTTTGAIRRHWGGMSGLSSNEVPIIAKKGEAIFPTVRLPDGQFGIRAQMPERAAGGDTYVTNNSVTQNYYTSEDYSTSPDTARADAAASYLGGAGVSEGARRAEESLDGVGPARSAVVGGGAPIHIENHVEVNITAADAQGVANGDPEAIKRLGDLISNIVTQKVNEQLAQAMRPGGMLNRGR